MSDLKMSDENIGYCLQQLAGYEPSDIECDDFEIAVNDDQFATMSIVRIAALASESHDQLRAENEALRAAISGALSIKALWLPCGHFPDYPPENAGEMEALHMMKDEFEKLLEDNQ